MPEAGPGDARGRLGALAREHHLEHGEGSAPWTATLATVDELLWSVEPKPRAEDRRRLVAGIPALVGEPAGGHGAGRHEEGCATRSSAHWSTATREAVRAGLKGTALRPNQRAAAATARPIVGPALEREMVPAGDIHVEEIRLRSRPRLAAVRNVFTRTGIWTNVERYTWVEFRREGAQPLRARLTWSSPAKGVYLFTNSTASAAISVSPEALAEQMRRGEARIVDDAPLVDRAVDAMMASLRDRAAQG